MDDRNVGRQHHVCQHVCSQSLDARIPSYRPVQEDANVRSLWLPNDIAHQSFLYAFDLGTPTHESEIGSIANDQLFVVTDSMKINKGCITKFQAWYMMHRCKNRCIEWELVTFLWSVEISAASLSVVCICILTDGAINKKHIYVAWRWWWGLAAAPAEAWKPNSIRAESGLPIVKQHPHLKHNYHF